RGFHDCRPRGRHQLRADQDRLARAVRPHGQVQSASAHRGGTRGPGTLRRQDSAESPLIALPCVQIGRTFAVSSTHRGFAMDQSIGLARHDRKRAVERLSAFVANSVDQAQSFEKPFYHLELGHVFPDDIYAQILALMPVTRDYRPMHGRSKGHDLEDGTHTRVKIDLFPEYIRNLPGEKRVFWDVVGRALCSEPVKQAFIRKLAPGLKKRFGVDYAKVGMYPIPILTRDIPGYLITPHMDT